MASAQRSCEYPGCAPIVSRFASIAFLPPSLSLFLSLSLSLSLSLFLSLSLSLFRRLISVLFLLVFQDAEVRRLAGMLSRMDEDALKQRKEYDQVSSA